MRASRSALVLLFVLGGCSEPAASLPQFEGPSPGGRWVYRTLIVDGGPLEGLSVAGVGLPEAPRRRIQTGRGVDVEITSSAEEIEWTELSATHFRFTERVEVSAPAGLCNPGDALGAPAPCPSKVTLQHDLLLPTEGFEPRRDSGAFLVATASGNAARAARPPRWGFEGVDADRVAFLDGVGQVATALGTDLGPVEAPARFVVHVRDDGIDRPWMGRVSRAVDPETGEILAADVFVDAGFARRVAAHLAARRRAQPGLDDRLHQERSALTTLRATRLALPDGALDRFRGRPVEAFEARWDALSALPPLVESALVSADVEALIEGRWTPGLDPTDRPMTSLQGLTRLLDVPPRGPRWAAGDIYPDPDPEVYVGALLFVWSPEDVQAGLLRHVILAGLLRGLGLVPNPAASTDLVNMPPEFWNGEWRYASSSVLDALAPEAQPWAIAPGAYDVAALRWLYAGEVAVFEAPLPDLSGLDIEDFEVRLCGDCGGAEVVSRLGARRFVSEAEVDPERRVPFATCSLEAAEAGDDPKCALSDFGPDARSDVAMRRLRWKQAYREDDPERFGLEPRGPVPRFVARARLGVAALQAAAWAAEHARVAEGPATDLVTAAAIGADLGAEMLTTPAPGRYCPLPGATPRRFLPARFFPEGCDPELPINGAEAQAQDQIEVPIGHGRGQYSEGTDFEDGSVLWAPGAALDRAFAPWLLYLPARSARPAAALSDLFSAEIDAFFEAWAGLDVFFVRTASIDASGAPYCGAGPIASAGAVASRRLLLEQPACVADDVVFSGPKRADVVNTTVAGARLGRLGAALRIYDMEEPDAAEVAWDDLPDGFCEVSEPLGGAVFRGVGQGSPTCGRLDALRRAVGAWEDRPDEIFGSVVEAEVEAVRLAIALR